MRMLQGLALVTLVSLAACSSDDATTPTLAGSYHATVFHITPAGQATVDGIAAGSTMTIAISSSGAVTGSLFVPASVTGEAAPLTADMAGTATLTGTQVKFTQSADTFVRDLTFTLTQSGLTATQTMDGVTVVLTLTRQ